MRRAISEERTRRAPLAIIGVLLAAALAFAGFAAAGGGADGVDTNRSPAAAGAGPRPFWDQKMLVVKAGALLTAVLDPTTSKACGVSALGPYEGQMVSWNFKTNGRLLRFRWQTNANATQGRWTLRASCGQANGAAPSITNLMVHVRGRASGHGLLAEHRGLRVTLLRGHAQALQGTLAASGVKVVKVSVQGAGRGGGGDPGDDYPAKWKNVPQDSVFDNWREYNRECTSFVAWALASRNGFSMPFYDNAVGWGAQARAHGFRVDSIPQPGSVAWSSTMGGGWGHVAYVVSVGGGSVRIEQYNATKATRGAYSAVTVPASTFTGYIHFNDLVAASPPTLPTPTPTTTTTRTTTTTPPTTSLPPTTTTTPTTTAAPPPQTRSETVGAQTGGADTWSNWTNAGGTQGPHIAKGQTVQIACKLPGFKVSDGNTWWYRIAQAPWSGQFYASADAFYNNGATSGSLQGTPPVDPAVVDC